MWTMIAERGERYHIADESFVSLCGNKNLLVRDYVEIIDGEIKRIGEGNQVIDTVPVLFTCKRCLKKLKK